MTPEWLMVGITAIYVIATIFICIFNYRSAQATRKQVEESNRQFEEKNRPFVTITFETIKGGIAVLNIANHGEKIAENVCAKISQEFIDSIPNNKNNKLEKESIIKLSQSTFSIGIKQNWYCMLGSHLDLEKMIVPLQIDLSYTDYTQKQYNESIHIDMTQYFWSIIYESPIQDMNQSLKEITKIIKNMRNKRVK